MAFGLLSLLLQFGSALAFGQVLRPKSAPDAILSSFVILATQITILGYALSELGCLSSNLCWLLGSLLMMGLALMTRHVAMKARVGELKRPVQASLLSGPRQLCIDLRNASPISLQVAVLLPLVTVLALGVINFAVVAWTAPHNVDSMTYHLARVGYYLQQGDLRDFDANYWAQVANPKGGSILIAYVFVATSSENLTQMVQFVSYWISGLAVFGISRKIGGSRLASTFAASMFLLLTDVLMEATTTQNDLLITAYVGTTIYFLLAHRKNHDGRSLSLAALALALAIGTKSSVLAMIPSVLLVGAYAVVPTFKRHETEPQRFVRTRPIIAFWLTGTLVVAALLVISSGYYTNYRNYGNPIAPSEVLERQTLRGVPFKFAIGIGTKNLLRYGFEFLSIDGAPPWSVLKHVNPTLRALPEVAVKLLGVDIESSEGTRVPFSFQKPPVSHEDHSYWGIIGFALIWPATLYYLLCGAQSTPRTRWVLSLASFIFLLFQSYSSPYDPWRGRYFTTLAVFAAPLTVLLVEEVGGRALRWYRNAIVVLACLFAVTSIVFRVNSPIVSVNYRWLQLQSVFGMTRLEQLMRNSPEYLDAARAFEAKVPANAVVAVALPGTSYEYPLFGQGLTRRLIPLQGGLRSVPENAEYLLYSAVPTCHDGDLHLGQDWCLRLPHRE